MFVGHYGVSYGAKAVEQRVPLWIFFVAVQFLDVLWAIFVLLGIEKVRIVPGITATNPLDLYYMPYTHGLPGALLCSVIAAVLYHVWIGRSDGGRGSVLVGVAVFSHWLLDLLVHRPDLPLWADRYKVGLSLWNYPVLAFTLEALALFAGTWLYLRSTRRTAKAGTAGFVLFGFGLLLVQAMTFFGSPPTSATAAAVTALVAYAGVAAVAAWLERKRNPHPTPSP